MVFASFVDSLAGYPYSGDEEAVKAVRGMLDQQVAHSRAWNKWAGYFEDVSRHTDDVNQLTPMMAAYYILARENPAEVDPRRRLGGASPACELRRNQHWRSST